RRMHRQWFSAPHGAFHAPYFYASSWQIFHPGWQVRYHADDRPVVSAAREPRRFVFVRRFAAPNPQGNNRLRALLGRTTFGRTIWYTHCFGFSGPKRGSLLLAREIDLAGEAMPAIAFAKWTNPSYYRSPPGQTAPDEEPSVVVVQ